jgi:elongation factor G
MTGGQGEFHMEFSHYDEAPANVQAKVIEAANAERGEAS